MKSQSIVWKVKGEVTDLKGFEAIVKEVAQKSHAQDPTKLYWWTISSDRKVYCDFDCYEDEAAAFEHLKIWSEFAERFSKVATIDLFVLLSDVSDKLKESLQGLPMHMLPYYGGFRKDAPAGKASEQSDIIWTIKGTVTDWDKFHESMVTLTSKEEAAEGSLMQWWCADKESGIFHILLRYADTEAAMAHFEVWNTYGGAFMESVKVDKFITFNALSHELLVKVSDFDPIQMNFFYGFAR